MSRADAAAARQRKILRDAECAAAPRASATSYNANADLPRRMSCRDTDAPRAQR